MSPPGCRPLAWLRREAFGFVFQGYHLIPSESACENVEMPAITPACPQRRQRAAALLARLGLAQRLDNRPTSSPAASSSGCRSPAR
jgi:macrolide transport system ATP-binding/permease protein